MIGSKAMKELSSLKRELKCWENMFERTHGRKPSKDDINTGSEEIRESYKRYRVLKEYFFKKETAECQQDDSDEVFGKNLNKKKEDLKLSTIPFRAKEWADITPVRLCHGQRPTKKAHETPTVVRAPEGNVDKDVLEVKQCENTEKDATTLINFKSSLQDVRVVDTSEHTLKSLTKKRTGSSLLLPNRQSRNVQFRKRGAISSAWLEKCKPELPLNEDHQVLSVSGLQENFLELENSPSNMQTPIAKGKVLDRENCTFSRKSEINVDALSEIGNETHMNVAKHSIGRKISPGTGFKAYNKGSAQEPSNKENIKTVASKYKERESKTYLNGTQHLKVRDLPQTSQEKCLAGSVSAADPFKLDHMEMKRDPPERSVEASQEIPNHKRKADERTLRNLEKPHKKLRCENDYDEQVHEEGKGGQSEDEDRKDVPNTVVEQELPLTTAKVKVSSGLVSDNFQKLNMKHRSYRRRGGRISGSAHKRRAWKQIMKSRGEFVPQKSWSSRGQSGRVGRSGACFKCGQEGHWAKNCKGPKKSKAVPKVENCDQDNDIDMDEFEPLPSIEEAALMAAGIHRDDEAHVENLVILPHKLPRPVVIPPTPPLVVEPLYQPVDGKPVEVTNEVLSSLEKLGFSTFRSGQQEAVMRILCGLSSLVVLSTGAGKSLCYQLPAFMYTQRSPCLTLVISPLVSLMEDQISGLPHGLKGACLHTNLTKAQRQKVVEDLYSGKVSVLLLSPEALVGGGSGNGCLPSVSQLPQIAFACIDEAHCVSEWSHNFRPSYLRVCKVLREKFGVRCFLGLTATATRATAASVAEHLGIVHDPEAVIRGGAVPPNLFLSVSCDSNKQQALLQLLQGRRFSQCDSIIIYCTRREQTEKLASTLRTCLQSTRLASGWNGQEELVDVEEKPGETKKKSEGKGKKKTAKAAVPKWDAECYHAGLSAAQRRRVQKRFMTGQLRIVVATVAFGMGLDKSDVRAIIHYNLPRSFESYVQEIGRAGRDGNPSHCHVFLDPEGKDMCELRRHVYANTVDRSSLKKLVQRTFPRCECRELQKQQRQQVAAESDMNDYLDLEEDYDDILETNLEAELQAVEQQYQR
ncbi:ATP-dependent DNA helicase Q4 [Stylophora pistillata]|uniref:DNA 3'-5' helicase n=1 Tax=Stylophora pistillata TaxID=50429 RepID=A0A2B4T1I4_STYPI|nr:ATP-dependent DNA helicase Q4 [Stylophora pistillata]